MIQNQIWKNIIKQKILLLFIGNTLFFVSMSYLLPIRFKENDDVIMLLFASGKYSGTFEPHLVFINFIYGHFLTFLYSIYSDIEWYTLLFAILHICSSSVISWYLILKPTKPVYKYLFIFLFYIIEIRLILLFQFTSTAALVALAGIILIRYEKYNHRLVGVLFFIIASLIRFEAAFLVLFVAIPLFIPDILKKNKFFITKSIAYLFTALALSIVFKYIDYQSYQQDKAWMYYQQYNIFRGQINDNPNTDKIFNHLPSNVTYTDYVLLLSFFPDAKVIDLNKIKLLNQELNQVGHKVKISNIYPSLRKYTILLLLVFILWIGCFWGGCTTTNRIVLIFSLLCFLSTLCYISLDRELKYRVFLSALLPFIIVMYSSTNFFSNPIFNKVIIISACCFILLFSQRTYKIWYSSYNWRKLEFNQQNIIVNQYLQNESNSIVPFANSLSIEYYSPCSISKSFKENQLFFSGWITNIPYNFNKFDSYLDLINRHAIFLHKMDIQNILPLIRENILLNYGIAVKTKIEIESKDYAIVRFYSGN